MVAVPLTLTFLNQWLSVICHDYKLKKVKLILGKVRVFFSFQMGSQLCLKLTFVIKLQFYECHQFQSIVKRILRL